MYKTWNCENLFACIYAGNNAQESLIPFVRVFHSQYNNVFDSKTKICLNVLNKENSKGKVIEWARYENGKVTEWASMFGEVG